MPSLFLESTEYQRLSHLRTLLTRHPPTPYTQQLVQEVDHATAYSSNYHLYYLLIPPKYQRGTGKGREELQLLTIQPQQQQQLPSPPMTSPITLICLIHGQPFENAFHVEISKENAILELKKFIINEQPQSFKDIDSKNLQLWKASIPDDNEEELRNFQFENDKLLYPLWKISKAFPEKPLEQHIHIIIQVPKQGPQRIPKRKLSVIDIPPQSTEVMIPAQKIPRQQTGQLYDCWQWWQIVRGTSIKEGTEGSITFLTDILGSEEYGSKLLVRDVYKHLYDKITCTSLVPTVTGIRKFNSCIIMGTPGIGKSFFGFYLLCRYANEHPNTDIVWQNEAAKISYHRNGSITYTIPNGSSWSLDPSGNEDDTIKQVPAISAGMYIVDAAEPEGSGIHPFVLITSPKQITYKKLQKLSKVQLLGMPVWELAELKRLWTIKFSSVDYEDWKARFDKWGGVPRSVLEKIDNFSQDLLEQNISTLDLDSCMHLRYNTELVRGTVLHTTVTEDGGYCDFRIAFASLHVENAVMKYGMEQQLIKLLDQSQGSGVFGSARGCIFEMLAHPMLARGGDFRARRLGDPIKEAVQIKLPRTQLLKFESINEVQGGYYYRPSRKTFESVDALHISGGAKENHHKLFQITVGKEHPIKVNGLEKILSELSSKLSFSTGTTKIRLYFVVPKDIFPDFTKVQTYVTTKQKPHQHVPQWIVDNVEQWALQLDYSLFSSTE